MKKLMARTASAVALAASVVVAPAVTGAMRADAALCTHNWTALGWWNVTNTTQVAATNTCGNMWSVRTDSTSDYVKGQFKKNGAWTDSVEGWKWTTTTKNEKEIVLDLVDGEPLRAWLKNTVQPVMLWY